MQNEPKFLPLLRMLGLNQRRPWVEGGDEGALAKWTVDRLQL